VSTELEKLFSPDVLAALDERARRVAEEVGRARSKPGDAGTSSSDLVDEETRRAVSEQMLISNKSYLTRAEAAKYLDVSERSIKEWAARATDQNPFPEVRAGADPRYRRAAIDTWAEAEGLRQRLKLAS
jgi:hypothetical protein